MSYVLILAVISAALLTLILSPTRRERAKASWPPAPATDHAAFERVVSP